MKNKLLVIVAILFFALSLSGCGQSPEEQYALIKEELKITENLQSNYFAEYYDMNDLKKAKTNAKHAIDTSNEEIYEDVLTELQAQNKAFSDYISSEVNKLYNVQTSTNATDKYPFAADTGFLDKSWCAKPAIKLTSSHPSSIDQSEAEFTDQTPDIHLWVNSSSHTYSCEIENIATKKILIMTENGETKPALVNTKVQFLQKDRHPVNMDETTALNERPAYLMNLNDSVVLAIQNYDGEAYYMPYTIYMYE